MRIQTSLRSLALAVLAISQVSPADAANALSLKDTIQSAVAAGLLSGGYWDGTQGEIVRPVKVDRCAYVLLMEGDTCTVDAFGNVIITHGGGGRGRLDIVNLLDELCKAGIGPRCYVARKEREDLWDFRRLEELRNKDWRGFGLTDIN